MSGILRIKNSDLQNISNRCDCVLPPNVGWLQYKLNQNELDHIWKCVDTKVDDISSTLAGNISGSYKLEDKNDLFFKNTLLYLTQIYTKQFRNNAWDVPVLSSHPYILKEWWVNYQQKNEFNPIHTHAGVYSFVIWLKIPTEYYDQNKNNSTNSPLKAAFSFNYSNLLGELKSYDYRLGKEFEGTLLFFPSKLNHQVYPFYNCDEDRISISGNIFLDESYTVHEDHHMNFDYHDNKHTMNQGGVWLMP